jgi:hypothetical protein
LTYDEVKTVRLFTWYSTKIATAAQPVSLTLAKNLPLGKIATSLDDTMPVVHFDLRISPQIFEQICNAPIVIVKDSWEYDS